MDITDPAKLGFDPDRLSRLTGWMQHWVDEGKFPGVQCLVARHGAVAFHESVGLMDRDASRPWAPDALVRIYSMTKPVTSVALLMLWEEARCHLDTPLDEFLPEFKDMQVLVDGAERIDQTRPAKTRLTLHHLLTHTSGLTYGFNEGVLPRAMNDHRIGFAPRRPAKGNQLSVSEDEDDLAAVVRDLAGLPLGFEPGARWNYSV